MVNRVTEAGDLKRAVNEIAQKLKEKSPLILQFAKQCVNKSMEANLTVGLNFESKLFSLCFGTEDQKEGVKAFFEKREPHFKGR
jgi:enoyl-CoA hydratase